MLKTPTRGRLTAALLAGLVGVATPLALQARDPETGTAPAWRSDPARRIFADFPAPRRGPAPHRAAVTHVVANCNDDGLGSLRGTIAGAASGDVIDLGQLACSRITLTTGAILVRQDDLTLQGPGREHLSIDGHRDARVFEHPGHGQFVLDGLTVENGMSRADRFDVAGGACIASAGYVTLRDSTVRDCYAAAIGAYGGAVYAYGLTMANSTLSGNTALGVHGLAGTAAFGGAAFVYTLDLLDSTISGNQAIHRDHPPFTSYDIGGGIVSVRGGRIMASTIAGNLSGGRGGGLATFGNLALGNSTISGNIAERAMGGALFMRWPSTLLASNSTITDNRAIAGGGLWLMEEGTTLQGTLLQGNHADAGHAADIEGPAGKSLSVTGAHNLVGSITPGISVPADTLDADPQLGPLQANGGTTLTHALAPGSVAIDAGSNPDGFVYDQRGSPFVRVHGAAADIGAYEWQPGAPPAVVARVPSLAHAGQALLAAIIALVAALGLRRRRRCDRP